ncbi:type II secretion system F family protein [Thalassoglobus sp.]|uniref:type II secretion system F family protein n=1 Tax=Thalassoglobus sp. TaxID=2795869 RepID=UPI003AA7E77E
MESPDETSDPQPTEPRTVLSPLMIAAGLRAAASEMSSSKDREGLTKLADALQTGASVDGALAKTPGLPADLQQIVLAGTQTGRLPQLLEEYLSSNRQSRTLWKSFYFSLLYPTIVLLFAMTAVSLFLALIVPQFKEIFLDFGVELPLLTEVIIKSADVANKVWLPVFVVFVCLVVLFLIRKMIPFAAFRARLFHSLPWIGTAQAMAAASEFCSRLAVLVECRMPLHEAMQIVSQTVHDPYMSEVTTKFSNQLRSGAPPEEVARDLPGLPHFLRNAFRWSNDPETFAEGLRSLAIVYGSQARVSAGRLIIVTEPVVFVGVALVTGTVVIGMFLPLIQLINELS